MHILLTGAAGSVGGATLRYLLAQGHQVTAIDIIAIPPALLVGIEKQAESNLSSHILDLANFSALDVLVEAATPSIDGAIHIGGIPNPLNHDPRVTYGVNVTTNYNILQTCAKYGINRIVQASSVNAYGLSFTPPGHKHFDELPISEKTIPNPEDPYATSKICCELQASAMCRYFPQLRIASLRYHMCKADYDEASKFSRHLSLWGWVSLDGCARAALQGLTSEGWAGHETFILASNNICWEGGLDPDQRFNGERPGSLELLERLWKDRYNNVDKAWWDNHPRRGFFDTSKARNLLGWWHDDDVRG